MAPVLKYGRYRLILSAGARHRLPSVSSLATPLPPPGTPVVHLDSGTAKGGSPVLVVTELAETVGEPGAVVMDVAH